MTILGGKVLDASSALEVEGSGDLFTVGGVFAAVGVVLGGLFGALGGFLLPVGVVCPSTTKGVSFGSDDSGTFSSTGGGGIGGVACGGSGDVGGFGVVLLDLGGGGA